MIVIIKTLQVILALSVLILVHELGHFTFAKLFGIRVDKFFLFFDAGEKALLSTKTGWFSKLFPKGKDWETEYGIGWLPLGGYCKICGMIDESMDKEAELNAILEKYGCTSTLGLGSLAVLLTMAAAAYVIRKKK